MKAVILSAGRGSRMGALTADRPKCLLEVGGRTLLDMQVAALRRAGVDEIGIVTGWQAARFDGMPFRLFHNENWAHSSMVDSLACAEEWLFEGPTVVSYGDIVYAPAAVSGLLSALEPVAIAYDPHWLEQWSSRFDNPLSDAETFRLGPEGMLLEIGQIPHSIDEIEGQYMGLLKIDPDGWYAIKYELASATRLGRRTDMTGLLNGLLGRTAVGAVPAGGCWHEFDGPADLTAGLPVLRELSETLETLH